jgi:hypothetical protein
MTREEALKEVDQLSRAAYSGPVSAGGFMRRNEGRNANPVDSRSNGEKARPAVRNGSASHTVPAAAVSNAAVMMPGSSHPPARTAAHRCAQTCGGGSLRTAARGFRQRFGIRLLPWIPLSPQAPHLAFATRVNSKTPRGSVPDCERTTREIPSSRAPLQPARDHQVLTSRLGDRVRPRSNTFQELQEFSSLL